jgi:hypothetical protein
VLSGTHFNPAARAAAGQGLVPHFLQPSGENGCLFIGSHPRAAQHLPKTACAARYRAFAIGLDRHARAFDAMIVLVRNRQDLEHQIVLLHAQGWSIRTLSRHFAMGRNTIRRILRKHRKKRDQGHDVLDQQRPVARQSKLDTFKPMIKALLEQYPDITGVRVYEELADSGFDGGRTIVTGRCQ